jgi:hypothetical protein
MEEKNNSICIIYNVLKVIRADLPQTRRRDAETKTRSSLYRNADISSEYVQIYAIKISYVVFGKQID